MSEVLPQPLPTRDWLAEAIDKNNRLLAELIQLQKFAMTGQQKICEVIHEQHKIFFHVPFGDVDYIQKKLVANRSFYELGILNRIRQVIPKNSVICDVGANIGNHTMFFAICCSAAHVYAFEPVRTNFEILARNIKLNSLTNVTAIERPVGISGSRGEIASYKLRNTGATSIEKSDTGSFEYISLDEMNLERLDFIKIDVEGKQADVIRGSLETLARLKPLVMIEARESEVDDVSALLSDIGMTPRERLGAFDFLYGFSS